MNLSNVPFLTTLTGDNFSKHLVNRYQAFQAHPLVHGVGAVARRPEEDAGNARKPHERRVRPEGKTGERCCGQGAAEPGDDLRFSRGLVGRPGEDLASRDAVAPRKPLNRRRHPVELAVHILRVFVRKRAPFPLQKGPGGNDAQRGAALDPAPVKGRMAQPGVRRPLRQPAADAVELAEGLPQGQDGVDSLGGSAAVGGLAENLDFKPGEALVGNPDCLLRGF